MITAAKSMFPALYLYVMDARALAFAEAFDCVFFSFNGIDYVGLRDRFSILSEIKRVLRPGGYLIYSTHNLAYARVPPLMESFWVSELLRSRNPVRLAVNCLRRFQQFKKQTYDNKAKLAFLNDEAHGFRLITTYVDIDHELNTLMEHGFEIENTIGCKKQTNSYTADDNYVYIMARKVTS